MRGKVASLWFQEWAKVVKVKVSKSGQGSQKRWHGWSILVNGLDLYVVRSFGFRITKLPQIFTRFYLLAHFLLSFELLTICPYIGKQMLKFSIWPIREKQRHWSISAEQHKANGMCLMEKIPPHIQTSIFTARHGKGEEDRREAWRSIPLFRNTYSTGSNNFYGRQLQRIRHKSSV